MADPALRPDDSQRAAWSADGHRWSAVPQRHHQRATVARGEARAAGGLLRRRKSCVDTNDNQTDAAAYLQADWNINRFVRVIGRRARRPVRVSMFTRWLRRRSRTAVDFPSNLPPTAQAGIVSPKLSVTVTPIRQLDLYLNFGSGFIPTTRAV